MLAYRIRYEGSHGRGLLLLAFMFLVLSFEPYRIAMAGDEDGALRLCDSPIDASAPPTYARHIMAAGGFDNRWAPSPGFCYLFASSTTGLSVTDDSGGDYTITVNSDTYPSAIVLDHRSQGRSNRVWPLPDIRSGKAAQYNPALAPDGQGGAYLAFQECSRGRGGDIRVQHILQSGSPAPGWPDEGRAISTASDETEPCLASDGNGGVWVAWRARSGRDHSVFATHIGPAGAVVANWGDAGRELLRTASDEADLQLACTGDDALLLWRSGSGTQIRAARISDGLASGQPLVPVNVSEAAERVSRPGFIANASGGMCVWSATSAAGGFLHCSLLTINSGICTVEAKSSTPILNVTHPGNNAPSCIADAQGSLLIAWEVVGSWSTDVFLQRLLPDGSPDASWPASGVGVAIGPTEEYCPRVTSDGQGGAIVSWVQDRPYDESLPTPISDLAALTHLASATELSWVRKLGPTDLAVGCTLAGGSTAKLAVFDVTGRQLSSRALLGFGPGSHVFSVRVPNLRPGVYFARLEERTQVRNKTVVIVH